MKRNNEYVTTRFELMDLVAKKCQPTNDRINVGNSINITLKYKFESLDDMEKQIGKKYKDFADFFRQIL